MLRPSEQSMFNSRLANLKYLTLKWADTEIFCKYILRSKYTVNTANNLLVYIKSSKLSSLQTTWLSELALLDFNIQYKSCKNSKDVDALNQHPCNLNSSTESNTDGDKSKNYLICHSLDLFHTNPRRYQAS